MPYMLSVQTVIETKAFLAAAKAAGMNEEERDAVVSMIANEPAAGDPDAGNWRLPEGAIQEAGHRKIGRLPSGDLVWRRGRSGLSADRFRQE